MSELKENKQDSKKLSSAEVERQLIDVFCGHAKPSQNSINTIISQLSEPILDISCILMNVPSEKLALAVRMIAKALEDNKICKELRVGNIDDKDLSILADMLKINTSIITLDLQWARLGNKSMQDLAAMLATNKTLKNLNLLDCIYLTDEGTKPLWEVLKNFKNTTLDTCYFSAFQSVGTGYIKKISDHLENYRSGKISQYVEAVASEIPDKLPLDLTKIVLEYLPEDKRVKVEKVRANIKPEDAKGNSYQYNFDLQTHCIRHVTLPLMLILGTSGVTYVVASEWFSMTTGSSILPNGATLALSEVGFFLIGLMCFGAYHFYRKKPDHYVPVLEENDNSSSSLEVSSSNSR